MDSKTFRYFLIETHKIHKETQCCVIRISETLVKLTFKHRITKLGETNYAPFWTFDELDVILVAIITYKIPALFSNVSIR